LPCGRADDFVFSVVRTFSNSDNLIFVRFDTLVVSDRGQVTLPKRLRERLASVTPLRVYSDAEIQGWLRDDRVTPAERKRVLKKARVR
jgi:hypothetical protein